MGFKSEKLLDDIGRHILETLKNDARIPHSRLGRIVGLSTPAVTERVRKLEEAGIIEGYHARIKTPKTTSAVTAFMELDVPRALYDRVRKITEKNPKVLECHHMSGQASFIIKVRADSVADLDSLVSTFSPLGQTRTSIVLSSFKDHTKE
ncbi:MAG TPA: AsnC family transcriptional regulator [Desulfobacteraceae bacterium]|nr:AsnC family transcriptional regulator [Desulfobacteraceae bacterium]